MESDNCRLMRLALELNQGLTLERTRALQQHVDKCQNHGDSSVDVEVWTLARNIAKDAHELLCKLSRMRDLQH